MAGDLSAPREAWPWTGALHSLPPLIPCDVMALANFSRLWIFSLSLKAVAHTHPRVGSKMALQRALASIGQNTGDILCKADRRDMRVPGVKFPVATRILFSTALET